MDNKNNKMQSKNQHQGMNNEKQQPSMGKSAKTTGQHTGKAGKDVSSSHTSQGGMSSSKESKSNKGMSEYCDNSGSGSKPKNYCWKNENDTDNEGR
jgi:hypothetical protein